MHVHCHIFFFLFSPFNLVFDLVNLFKWLVIYDAEALYRPMFIGWSLVNLELLYDFISNGRGFNKDRNMNAFIILVLYYKCLITITLTFWSLCSKLIVAITSQIIFSFLFFYPKFLLFGDLNTFYFYHFSCL